MSLSPISAKLAFLRDGNIATIENFCVPMVVKCTLFAMHKASLLLGALFDTIFATCVTFATRVMLLLLGASFNKSCTYRTLCLRNIANTQDCTSQMPKMC